MKEFGCVKMLQWQDTLRDEYFLNWYWDTVASVLAHNRSEASQFSRFWIRQQLCSRVDTAWSCWHDGTVVKLADHIQQQAEFGQLPILADALEEAGCTDRAILDHCRGNHPHSGYCWVADLFASKNEPRP